MFATSLAQRKIRRLSTPRIWGFCRKFSEIGGGCGRQEKVGGYVAPTSVDVVHIYFGYPTTHEDDAVQAVRAGMALVNSVAGMGAMVEAGITARAGIATEIVVVENEHGAESAARPVAIGEAPARAGGMLALAAPGQVVVSRHTRLLLGQHFDLCAVDVSGPGQRADRPEAWHVRGERDPVSR